MIETEIYKPNENKQFSWTENELYWQYKNELWGIEGCEHKSEDEVRRWYFQILHDSNYIIRINDTEIDKEPQVGFCFIGISPNCHQDADFYIQDAYILQEYRRKQIMEGVLQSFIKEHPGVYSLFLIDENEPAKLFWDKQFSILNYKEINLVDYNGMESENVHLHGYKIDG